MLRIEIHGDKQLLLLFQGQKKIREYKISTAANGFGQQNGSYKTPVGKHIICDKIGANMPINTVFISREPTGEVYSHDLDHKQPDRDWILSRILWLSGTEPGINLDGTVDTKNRYIYIHGGASSRPLGTPNSKGCIRMNSKDIIELFDLVSVGTPVDILKKG